MPKKIAQLFNDPLVDKLSITDTKEEIALFDAVINNDIEKAQLYIHHLKVTDLFDNDLRFWVKNHNYKNVCLGNTLPSIAAKNNNLKCLVCC